jgi:hypothetical protein
LPSKSIGTSKAGPREIEASGVESEKNISSDSGEKGPRTPWAS